MSKTAIELRKQNENYGPGTPCSQCGDNISDGSPKWTEYCQQHAESRANPIKIDLEKLRDELIGIEQAAGDEGNYKTANIAKSFAVDVQRIIDRDISTNKEDYQEN